MRARIYVSPALALKAGKNVSGYQYVEFEPSQIPDDLRETLAEHPSHDSEYNFGFTAYDEVDDANVENLIKILQKTKAYEEREKAERAEKEVKDLAYHEKTLAEWLARTDDKKIRSNYETHGCNITYTSYKIDIPSGIQYDERVQTEMQRIIAICKEKTEASEKAYEESKAQKKAEEAVRLMRKRNQLTDFINENGSDLEKEQWEEGLLSVTDAVELMWRFWSAKYSGAINGDHSIWENGDIKELKHLSQTQYAESKKIKKAFPNCKYSYHYEDNDSTDDDFEDMTYMTVTEEVGDIVLSAHFNLDV